MRPRPADTYLEVIVAFRIILVDCLGENDDRIPDKQMCNMLRERVVQSFNNRA